MQTVQLVFLSIFNATWMYPNIWCDGVKRFFGGTYPEEKHKHWTPSGFSFEKNRLFVMLPQRFDQRVCFSRANSIASPSSSAPSHRFLRLLPRRSHARRIGIMAECSIGSHSGPSLEEDDGGEFVPVVERDPSFN
jgi:hypothetical protein